MEKPILIYRKNAETNTNKLRLPKAVIDKMGKNFYLEVFEDKMILKPMKKENK